MEVKKSESVMGALLLAPMAGAVVSFGLALVWRDGTFAIASAVFFYAFVAIVRIFAD